jgi:ribonuclease P protein component
MTLNKSKIYITLLWKKRYEEINEKNVSTKKENKEKRTWVSEENEFAGRQESVETTETQRKKKTVSLEKLKSRWDFERVFSRGRLVKNDLFVIYFTGNNAQKGNRVGICVGKSVGSAVRRNRLKRQIREAVWKIVDKNEIKVDGIDLVIVARKSILNESFWRILESVKRVFSRVLYV